jgi:hypothetical protein
LLFGLPSKWWGDQLPSKKEVGTFYVLKRAKLESAWHSAPSKRDVAIEVTMFNFEIFTGICFNYACVQTMQRSLSE